MQELDYAEMLEIPVSTVNVTKKKSFFKRRETPRTDLKEQVVDSVNERVGAYVEAENLSDPPAAGRAKISFGRDKGSIILFSEIAAVCAIVMAIFLTNVFMPTSAINSFIASLTNPEEENVEPSYNQLTLSSVVGDFSDAEVMVSRDGVISFTNEGCVYPVCDGKIVSVSGAEGQYVVEIAHTSTFSSVIKGLSDVFVGSDDTVKANLPFAYSDGKGEVSVSLYDGETLLNCFYMSDEAPVWNS